MKALHALGKAVASGRRAADDARAGPPAGQPDQRLQRRASTCTPATLKKAGETDERICRASAAWREAPYFTDAERAALALTEAVTRLADRADAGARRRLGRGRRPLRRAGARRRCVLAIATINVWNRLNVATRQPVPTTR